MIMKKILILIIVLVMTGAFAGAACAALVIAGSHRIINDNDTLVLQGNVHPLARPDFDRGATEPSLPMQRMILTLRRSPVKQAELDRLIAELHDPASPSFHHWLTPEEFGERFGPAPEDIASITGWLTSHGFTIDEVAKGRSWVNFSGSVGDVQAAFHTQIHNYYINGRLHHANDRDPSIPRGLSDLAVGIVSLHNFPLKMMNTGATQVQPDFTSGSTHYLSPGDFANIYNLNALYSAGIDGSGQTIAIVGRTHPSSDNWATFRSMMGLSSNPPQVIVNGDDPGDLGASEDHEADLDVEWSGAVAKNAAIIFVTSKTTTSTDGVALSAQYIVNNNLAPILSTSFGLCEQALGSSGRSFYNSLWQQAAGQGITALVSSGDSGAAGCDSASATRGTGKAVNGLASTPYNVAVGGTQFNEGAGSYWNTSNTGYTSALGYIPEIAWNESSSNGGSGLWSTGGGKSAYYGKPSWQVSPGVPVDSMRDVPDVSLTAATHDGYLICSQGLCSQGTLNVLGGTSASTPSFAGLMALIAQKTGQRQGNANTRFYQLGAAQYGSGGATVFHDTTSGNNSVTSVTGYSCTTGYDLVTGLGSVDANALVNNWTPDFTIAASPAFVSVPQSSTGTSTISTTVSGNFSNAITLSASGLPNGVTAAFSPASIAAPGAGSSTMTITVGASSTPGTYTVTVTGTGGSTTHTTTTTLTSFSITASVNGSGGSIALGTTRVVTGGSTTLTVTPFTGFHLASLIDNGANVTASVINSAYSITNITTNHSLIATFAVNTYSINTSNNGNGSITPSSASVNYGANVSFTITPNSGYTLSGLTDNGTAVTAVENPPGTFTYVITNVSADHTINATFSQAQAVSVPAMGTCGILAGACGLLGLAGIGRSKK